MKPQREPKQTATTTTLIDKLLAKKGPVTLTRGEVERLQALFLDIGQENLQHRRMMSAIAEALQRHNLQVTHTENPDGSVSYDLENVPSPPVDDAPVSMN